MDTTPAHARLRRPAGRYDEPTDLPRPLVAVGAALLVAALVGVAWWAYQRSAAEVTPTLVGYRVVDDHTLSLTLEVSRKASDDVQCRVEALGRNGLPVGGSDVVLRAGEPDRRTVTITTSERARAGVIQGCGVVHP